MAAVTQTSTSYRHIFGDCVVRTFFFTGATGSTLDTSVVAGTILYIGLGVGSLITAVVQSTTAQGTALLTITSSAPMTAENILVIARKG